MLIKLDELLHIERMVNGQHKGIVLDIEDPKGLGRVKCAIQGVFPSTEAGDIDALPWCYPQMPLGISTGSAESGTFIAPELHSEVLVEFPEGDIYHPVYVGFRVNERNKQPLNDETGQAGFTLGDIQFRMNKGDSSMEMFHPSGFTITVDGDGAFGMSIPKSLSINVIEDTTIAIGGQYVQSIGKDATLNIGKNAIVQVEKDLQFSAKKSISFKSLKNIVLQATSTVSQKAVKFIGSFTGTHDTRASVFNRRAGVINDGAGVTNHNTSASTASPVSITTIKPLANTLSVDGGGLGGIVGEVGAGLATPLQTVNELGETTDWDLNPDTGQVWIPKVIDPVISGTIEGTIVPSGQLMSGTLNKNMTAIMDKLPNGLQGILNQLPKGLGGVFTTAGISLEAVSALLIAKGLLLTAPDNEEDLITYTTGGINEILDVVPSGRDIFIEQVPQGFGGYVQSLDGGVEGLSNLISDDISSLINALVIHGIDNDLVVEFIKDLNLKSLYAKGLTTLDITDFLDKIQEEGLGIGTDELTESGESIGELLLTDLTQEELITYFVQVRAGRITSDRVIDFANETDPQAIVDAGIELVTMYDLLKALHADFLGDELTGVGLGSLLRNPNISVEDSAEFINDILDIGFEPSDISPFLDDLNTIELNSGGVGFDAILKFLKELYRSSGDDSPEDNLNYTENIEDLLRSGLSPKSLTSFVNKQYNSTTNTKATSLTSKGKGNRFKELLEAISRGAVIREATRRAGETNKASNILEATIGDIINRG